MKKNIFLLAVLILILSACFSKPNEEQYKLLGDMLSKELYGNHVTLSKISNNKIYFYVNKSESNSEWLLVPEITFDLPEKYDFVFLDYFLDDFEIRIINDKKTSIYYLNDNNWDFYSEKENWDYSNYDISLVEWIERIVDVDILLPINNYDKLFSYNLFDYSFLIDDRIKFWSYSFIDGNLWNEKKDMEFFIKKKYKNLIMPHPFEIIFLAEDNQILYYWFQKTNQNWEWIEMNNISTSLSYDIQSLISADVPFLDIFGTKNNSGIQFYFIDVIGSDSWQATPIPELFFTISSENEILKDEQMINGVWGSIPYEQWRSQAILGGSVAIFVFDNNKGICQIGVKNYLPFGRINIEGEFISSRYNLRINSRKKNISVIDEFNDVNMFRYVFSEDGEHKILKLKDKDGIVTDLYKWDERNL